MGCSDTVAPRTRGRHIALLLEYPTIYGGENSILACCSELSSLGYTFSVICPPGDRMIHALNDRKIPHHVFFFRDAFGMRYPLQKLRRDLSGVLQGLQIDALHANSLSTARIAGPVGEALKIPTLGHIRDIMRVSKQAMHDINTCNLILCVSKATLLYHRQAGLDESRSIVQYNGVNLDVFFPATGTMTLRDRFGIKKQTVLIGTAGQIILRKGLDTTVRAFAMLRENVPDLHLLVAGERNSSKAETMLFENEVREFIKSNGLRDRIHFAGYIDDMPSFYQSLDIFVHAARQEPLGRVLLEAAACGIPVIATRVGGTEEIFPTSEQAILIQPDDTRSLAQTTQSLVTDGERRLKLGSAGREAINKNFNIRDVARELTSHYQRLLKGTEVRM